MHAWYVLEAGKPVWLLGFNMLSLETRQFYHDENRLGHREDSSVESYFREHGASQVNSNLPSQCSGHTRSEQAVSLKRFSNLLSK